MQLKPMRKLISTVAKARNSDERAESQLRLPVMTEGERSDLAAREREQIEGKRDREKASDARYAILFIAGFPALWAVLHYDTSWPLYPVAVAYLAVWSIWMLVTGLFLALLFFAAIWWGAKILF